MKAKTIKPKLAKLDILCSNSDWYKERQYIQFRDGFAVATDGHVLARWKHSLGDGSGLIHSSQYKQFRKLPGPHEVTVDGLSACSGKVVFPWAEGINYPEWESVFDFKEAPFQRETIVDLMRFALIQKAFKPFIEGGFGVMLCERKNNHLCYPYHGNDFVAVLMKMAHLEHGPIHEPQSLYNP